MNCTCPFYRRKWHFPAIELQDRKRLALHTGLLLAKTGRSRFSDCMATIIPKLDEKIKPVVQEIRSALGLKVRIQSTYSRAIVKVVVS